MTPDFNFTYCVGLGFSFLGGYNLRRSWKLGVLFMVMGGILVWQS